eukprot:TRINITY_DN76222_c0_g1_i1.p1 TRINITY_DN76222_c0_g1~~TRINITY_DN76222_c0_g1_i1.p1  ORF type:complete len:406 (-),score=46.96 TRINITY_DN76222_c0_g1_i1:255-1307(-)
MVNIFLFRPEEAQQWLDDNPLPVVQADGAWRCTSNRTLWCLKAYAGLIGDLDVHVKCCNACAQDFLKKNNSTNDGCAPKVRESNNGQNVSLYEHLVQPQLVPYPHSATDVIGEHVSGKSETNDETKELTPRAKCVVNACVEAYYPQRKPISHAADRQSLTTWVEKQLCKRGVRSVVGLKELSGEMWAKVVSYSGSTTSSCSTDAFCNGDSKYDLHYFVKAFARQLDLRLPLQGGLKTQETSVGAHSPEAIVTRAGDSLRMPDWIVFLGAWVDRDANPIHVSPACSSRPSAQMKLHAVVARREKDPLLLRIRFENACWVCGDMWLDLDMSTPDELLWVGDKGNSSIWLRPH